jgi:hypothetical protein
MAEETAKMAGKKTGTMMSRSIISRCVCVMGLQNSFQILLYQNFPPGKYSLASCTSDTSIREPAELTNAVGCLSFSIIVIDMFPRLLPIHIMIGIVI